MTVPPGANRCRVGGLLMLFIAGCGEASRTSSNAADGASLSGIPGGGLDAPGEGVEGTSALGGLASTGGQTTDFGDGQRSACDVIERELVSAEGAAAEGLPVASDLALLLPSARVELQRGNSSCARAAGTLAIDAQLTGIYIKRGAPVPELADRVECSDELAYEVTITLSSSEGVIAGQFHTELATVGSRLSGSAQVPPESLSGSLALRVDPSRGEHSALTNLEIGYEPAGVSGGVVTMVYYAGSQGVDPDEGERLFWSGELPDDCDGDAAPPVTNASASGWLTLDAYRQGTTSQ